MSGVKGKNASKLVFPFLDLGAISGCSGVPYGR